MYDIIKEKFQESINVKEKIINNNELLHIISDASDAIINSYLNGGKVLLCGNGGSASDALHIAGELVGRFQKERKSYSAYVLNSDVATMTAIANDYGYDQIFSRQVEGHMKKQDILIGISTSGNSVNIMNAFLKAKEVGGITIALTGKSGGTMKDIADYVIVVPSNITARIQESHITIGHIICEIIENSLL